MLVLLGVQIASGWRPLSVLEHGGAKLWQKLSPLAARLVPVRKMQHALGLGMLWGWLPCGLVYSVLPLAATAGNVKSGALTMLLFGLGTMPALLASAGLAGFFATRRRQRSARLVAGILIVLLGIVAAWSPLRHWSGAGTHHHAMISGIYSPSAVPAG